MTAVVVELVVVLLLLPFAAIALGHLFGRVESWVMRVRARRCALRQRATAPGRSLPSRGHSRGAGPERLRDAGYGRFH